MWSSKIGVLSLLWLGVCVAQNVTNRSKIFCYYDGSFYEKNDVINITVARIEPALPMCTHLIYGYAQVDPATNRLSPRNASLELDAGKGYYRDVTSLKSRFPGLKVFLSVGGNRDVMPKGIFQKYLSLLESENARKAFIASAYATLKTYGFDGLDLAWQFPQTKPKRIRAWSGQLWHSFKKLFTGDSILDPKAEEHREQFVSLVRDLKTAFQADQFELMYTHLPHVNHTVFLNVSQLKDNLDYVNVAAYDQQTSVRNPKEADYFAPLYELTDRVPGNSVDGMVNVWSSQGMPLNKIVVGIAAYGRGWKMVEESGTTGIPPVRVEGPSEEGGFTQTPGFYSFGEVCFRLRNYTALSPKSMMDPTLTNVEDPTGRFGPYAFRIPTAKQNGVWISYENPASVGHKAAYVRAKGLAGVSINDLALDDYRGQYFEEKFPIVRAVRDHL